MSCLKAETVRDALACFSEATTEDVPPVLLEPGPAGVLDTPSAQGFEVQMEIIEGVFAAKS